MVKIPSKADPSADAYHGIPAKLNLYLKVLKLSKKCKKFINAAMIPGKKFLAIKCTFQDLEQSSKLEVQERKLKLNSTFDYNLKIDNDFVTSLEDNPAIFKLHVSNENQDQEIFISETELEIGEILNVVNRKIAAKIGFGDDTYLKLWYKFGCNKRELKILCSGLGIRKKASYLELLQMIPEHLNPAVAETKNKIIAEDTVYYKPELAVTIVELYFLEGSFPLVDENIELVYVEYSFLGEEGPEMETPFSVPVGTITKPSIFNFTKKFDVDVETNCNNYEQLVKMLNNKDEIKFVVIAEPVEILDSRVQICEEIGYAEVNFEDIVDLQENVDSYQYEILDLYDPNLVLGYITVKFEGILGLKKVLNK